MDIGGNGSVEEVNTENLAPSEKHSRGEMGSGRDLFSQQINKPSTEGDFEATGCGEPVSRKGVQQVRKGLCHSRGQGVAPRDLSLGSEVLLEYTIILDVESPHPCSLSRTRILVGVLAQSVEDDRSPVRKWWKERVMSVMALTLWFPKTQPHGPVGKCSRRKKNVGW